MKLCYTAALEWSSLVPGPKAKSSSEITNLTLFIVSSHFGDSLHVLNPSNTIMILFYDAHLVFFRRTSQDICFAISLERTDFLLLFVCLFSLLKWFSVRLSSWMWICLQKVNSKWPRCLSIPSRYFLKDKLLALDFLSNQALTSFQLSEKQ